MLDLGEILGKDWHGWAIGNGQIFCPSWRRGFTPGEFQATFYRAQQVRTAESTIKRLQRDLERRSAEADAAENLTEFYRRQVQLESRYGMVLQRVFT